MSMNRNTTIDFIKAVALFLVFTVHGLTHLAILNEELVHLNNYIALSIRYLSMTSIPIFLIVSGYLSSNKELDAKYIKKMSSLLISYVIVVVLTTYYNYYFLNESLSTRSFLANLLHLNRSDYAWFARMFFFLYLLIPYFNLFYESLKQKKNKATFITVLVIVAGFPNFINAMTSFEGFELSLPAYFVQLYPMLYFFIGKYIREYKVQFKQGLILLLVFSIMLLKLTFSYFRFGNSVPHLAYFGSYGSISYLILATLIFLGILNSGIEKVGLNRSLKFIAVNSFDIYLISHLFDKLVYAHTENYSFLISYPLIRLLLSVSISITLSIAYAILKTTITNNVRRITNEKKYIDFGRSSRSV